MYIGDFRGRIWRVARGRLGKSLVLRGDWGGWFIGVSTAEGPGEYCDCV